MRIINLIENTDGHSGCAFAHGLSFYVETDKHRLLLDAGPSEEIIKNANTLGVNLQAVDTLILSHGHYDHSGGIIPFSDINDRANIYMQKSVVDDYFTDDGKHAANDCYADDGKHATERFRYIGIDKNIVNLPQIRFIDGDKIIDEELELFVIKNRSHELPFTNRRLLVKKNGVYQRDDFEHEHFLVIHQNGKSVLMSGCAHNGILSILDAYVEKYKKAPDLVISGFHLMKKTDYKESEIDEIKKIAMELKKYPTRFVTCHCTGMVAFDVMKQILGESLVYVHSGEEIDCRDI